MAYNKNQLGFVHIGLVLVTILATTLIVFVGYTGANGSGVTHSVVGLGEETADSIQVLSMGGPLAIMSK